VSKGSEVTFEHRNKAENQAQFQVMLSVQLLGFPRRWRGKITPRQVVIALSLSVNQCLSLLSF